MDFSRFSSLCEELENTSSSLEKIEKISTFLSSTPLEQTATTVRLLSGKPVFPPELKSGIGSNAVKQALSNAVSLPVDQINASLKETGDIGTTALLLKKKNTQKQATLIAFTDDESSLSVPEVHEKFNEIAALNGSMSSSRKIKSLESLLSSVSPHEAKYICRLALEDLRVGVAENTIVNAIAKTTQVESSIVDRAFNLTNDIGLVAQLAITQGQTKLECLIPQPNRYIRPMLGQISKNTLEEIVSSFDNAICEWKYDGARLQIHKDGDNVRLFSKKPEDVTNSLPDVVESIRKYVNCEKAILEGEVVAIDENNNPLPFKTLMQRIRRINNISSYVESTPVCTYLFDVLLSDDEALIDQPLHLRREQLERIVKPSDRVLLSTHLSTNDISDIDQMYNEALRAGHEGIMIKNPMSVYTAGKRGKDWIKKKPLMENLDLAITGGEWGQGRRANVIGSYTLSCLDSKSNSYLSVGKLGTGISDELLAKFTEMLKPYIESENGTEIVISPSFVLEISYEEIQESPKYNSGYSLRFPRLVRLRDDKGITDIAPLEQVKTLFAQQ